MANQKNKCNSVRKSKRQLFWQEENGHRKKTDTDSPGAETNITTTVTPDTSAHQLQQEQKQILQLQ